MDGGTNGWIDTTIAQNGNKTYHITKSHDEQIIMEVTTDKQWWKQGTNWTRVQSNIGQSRFGSVEGPAVFKDHSNDNRWYLFVDDLPQPGYQPMISTDLDKGWDYLDSPDYFLTINTKHGGVISLTKKQYDSLRRADAVSLADSQPAAVKVPFGATEGTVAAALPATAKVNMAYNMGTSDLPVKWDISPVKTDKEGTYSITGTICSIGANKNQWMGKDGSTSYLAEDKQLYSSKELKVSVDVQVEAKPQEILPTRVTLDRSSVSLTVGKKLTLKAQVAPGNAADKTLAWKSSKASVATVSQNGTVTAKAAGTANITVSTVNGKTAVCKVTVKPKKIAVKSITLSQKKATLGVKEKLALKAAIKPSNATDRKVKWTTSKSSVATVTSKGVVTAKKKGTAKITATADGKKAVCTIIVKAAPKKISLNARKATVKRGKTYQIRVKLPKNTASYKVTYSTSNKKVATVSSAGKVKGLKKGTAMITVKTFNKKRATIKIMVK